MQGSYQWIIIGLLIGANFQLNAQNLSSISSNKKSSITNNYIRTCLYSNFQAIPNGTIRKDTAKGKFGYSQVNLGFYTPLFTKTWESLDGLKLPSFQLLGTGNLQILHASFNGGKHIENLTRLTLGIRGIYSSGSKGVLFIYFSPFLSQNNFLAGKRSFRFTGMLLYSRTVNAEFSYQIGINRTYLYGVGAWLPIIGFRIGRLDKFHLQMALPRYISLNLPISPQWLFRAYTKASGGVFNLQNFDPSFTGQSGNQILFGMSEILSGLEIDFIPSRSIALFVSAGFSSARKIGFYQENQGLGSNFFDTRQHFASVPSSGFFQFGIAIRLGNARDIYNNSTMYDASELNSVFDPGDVNQRAVGSDIPDNPEKAKIETLKKNQLRDIKDYLYEE
jgi:hypothetical protein